VLGNGSEEDVLGVGTYKLRLHGENTLLIHDAIYALGEQVYLFSLVSSIKLGFFFNSDTDGLDILYGGNMFGHIKLKNDFLVLDLDDCHNNSSSAFVSPYDSNFDFVTWHARLRYISQDRMSRLVNEGLLDQVTKVKLPRCESCLVGKAIINPFGKATRVSTTVELTCSDICGLMNVKTRY